MRSSRPAAEHHEAFETLARSRVASLAATVEEYRHRDTDLRHVHVAAKAGLNAFLIAFRTAPSDSSGCPHVLEHLTLCGSRRFPVRDAFFRMRRRSVCSVMNAFTWSDLTAYHFATPNAVDFANLATVFLDATFAPNLHELDFAAEAHRLELRSTDAGVLELTRNGVVLNEMKGAYVDPTLRLRGALRAHLFPTTPYRFESGGEPQSIATLTHTELVQFHKRHYRPDNTIVMTYGALPATTIHGLLHAQRLTSAADRPVAPPTLLEPPLPVPIRAAQHFPSTAQRGGAALGWLLGERACAEDEVRAELLQELLLGDEAAPLRRAIEQSRIGRRSLDWSSADRSAAQLSFVCGVDQCAPGAAAPLESLTLEVLEQVAARGIDKSRVDTALHQLELRRRLASDGRHPRALSLLIDALPRLIHGAGASSALDTLPALIRLREQADTASFAKSLVRTLLLDNSHRACVEMQPDCALLERTTRDDAETLARTAVKLDHEARAALVALSRKLEARRACSAGEEMLPRLPAAAAAQAQTSIAATETLIDGKGCTVLTASTNGLVVLATAFELGSLDETLGDDIGLFCDCLANIAVGERSHLEVLAHQSLTGTQFKANIVPGGWSDAQRGVLVWSGVGLAERASALAALLGDTVKSARFDDVARTRALVARTLADSQAALARHGHVYAVHAAAAAMHPGAALLHRGNGLAKLVRLQAIASGLDDGRAATRLAARLHQIQEHLLTASRRYLIIGERETQAAALRALEPQTNAGEVAHATRGDTRIASRSRAPTSQAFVTDTSVSFCAAAFGAVDAAHPDAAALAVLGPLINENLLHSEIRARGGAYGTGAHYAPATNTFQMFSYRDPRLDDTLAVFRSASDWARSATLDQDHVDEAKLGALREIDRSVSPLDDAMAAYLASLHGHDTASVQRMRRRILSLDLATLRDAATRYLDPTRVSVAVITNRQTLDTAQASSFQLVTEIRDGG